MPKIIITVQNTRTGKQWEENYDTRAADVRAWAKALVKNFNNTLRPGESPRTLLRVQLVGASTTHAWVKNTDGMSREFRGRIVDMFRCSECGISGKRYRLDSSIKRDSKYRAKKYEECHRGAAL